MFLGILLSATISMQGGDAPPNDHFTNRFLIAGPSITVTGCNYYATKETGEPTMRFTNGMSNTGGKSVWWGWTPNLSGMARMTTFGSGNGSMDTILAVYTRSNMMESVSNLVWVTGNDEAATGVSQSQVTFLVTAGTQYEIAVDGFNGGANMIVLNVHMSNTPPSVFLASPTNNAVYSVPATIPLTVYANDYLPATPWPNGVSNVSFFTNGVFLKRGNTNTTSPVLWTNSVTLDVGSYIFSAITTDRGGTTNGTNASITVVANVPPVVSLTNIADGTVFYTPVSLPLMASAFDPYFGIVTNVEFYTNEVKFAQNTAAPYSNYWSGLAVGAYTLTVRAYDNGGLIATSAPVGITVNANQAPAVSITNLTNGTTFSTPVNITIAADATDNPGGSIASVSIYSGSTKLSQLGVAPYSYTWTNVAVGAYSFTAVATDNGGLNTTSAPVSVTVVPNSPPAVSLSTPTDGQGFVGPASVSLTAVATDTDGWVTNVSYFTNGVKVGQATNAPFSYVWTSVLAGNYTLTAVAYDNGGTNATSAPVAIVVSNTAPPVVKITSPATNATFYAGLDMALLATATDSDGSVSKVEYYRSNTKIGESGVVPFSFLWTNVQAGSYSLRAVATDNSGTKGTSAVINVTILGMGTYNTNLIPGESVWKYLDNGTDPGTAWRGIAFNDNSWFSGRGQLGYGDGDEVTTVGYGPSSNNKYITTYFRKSLFLTNIWRYTNLILRVIRDDGAVVYINSNEVFRSDMPEGAVNYQTLSANNIYNSLDECITWYPTNLAFPTNILRNGTNVIAVEIHQSMTNSEDISFDLELIGERFPDTNQLPSVVLTAPNPGAVFYPPVVITNSATAADLDGGVTNIDFYANGVRIGRDRTSPFSINWTNPAAGIYSLVGVAFDDKGETNTSAAITIRVINGSPPSVGLTSPTNGMIFEGRTNVELTATATDTDGSITNVEFFRGTNSLGSATSAPYSVVWTNAPEGTFILRAAATDNDGISVTSAPVTIMIGGMASMWVAYNDHIPGVIGTQTSSNASTINCLSSGNWGYLKNIADGSTLSAIMTATYSGSVVGGDVAGTPYPGTPLANTFDGYVYFGSNTSSTIQVPTGASFTLTFSGLNPARRYKFQGGTMRALPGDSQNSVNYTNRWTVCNLAGVDSAAPAHQTSINSPWGILTADRVPSNLSGFQAAILFGVNTNGDMIEWDSIAPGSDGAFSVTCAQYTGPVPAGYGTVAVDGSTAGATLGYGISGIRLEEYAVNGSMVLITTPTNNQVFVTPANVLVKADPIRFGGAVTNIAYYNSTTKIGDDPYITNGYTYSIITTGAYSLLAVASDNTGVVVTSAPVTIKVQSDVAPSIVLLSPSSGTYFEAPADVTMTASASDSDDGLASVSFFANGNLIGQRTTSPYSYTWTAAPSGTYDITAIAADTFGLTRTSVVARIYVYAATIPTISSFTPAAGAVSDLSQVAVEFSEAVSGVDVADLLVNGSPATSMTNLNNTYTFFFTRPLEGVVVLTWNRNHGIYDRELIPKAFSGISAGETAQYVFTDTVAPVVVETKPMPGVQVSELGEVEITFSEPVIGLQAEDLLVNGVAATNISGTLDGPYRFRFAQPAEGTVTMSWAATNGIQDRAVAHNAFTGTNWTYLLNTSGSLSNIVISEIMYHPVPELNEDVRQEWVELHNLSATPVRLLGWQLKKAVKYTFGDITIPGYGYLVVSADVDAFHTRYPSVTNVVGPWVGRLGNNGDTIKLENAQGTTVNEVAYASQGDWAKRISGSGERQVTRITRSGTTYTVTLPFHDFSNTDYIWIYGADQPEFNGIFRVANATVNTFTYTTNLSSTNTEATGVIICRQLSDLNYAGWSWTSLADGLGRSMELVNKYLPNAYGQNWKESAQLYGTPGAANSVARGDIAPLILDVQHFPLVPRSTNTVTVSARIVDEQTFNIGATLWYRDQTTSTPGSWISTNMWDDGSHGDAVSGDFIFSAQLPAKAHGTVTEFYVDAFDEEANHRTWPQPALGTNDTLLQWANALYQVEDSEISTNQPIYRIILTATETNILRQAHENSAGGEQGECNAQMNGTVITIDGMDSLVRYNVGVRNRGGGSRGEWPMNYHFGFPNDNPWKGVTTLQLSANQVHTRVVGAALAEGAGLDTAHARAIQLRLNTINQASAVRAPDDGQKYQYGSYVELEAIDSDYAKNHWPLDSGGNIYRGTSGNSQWRYQATLSYAGTSLSYYFGDRPYGTTVSGRGYFKASNSSENDWSDLLGLMAVLSTNYTNPDEVAYAQAVSQVVNVEQWMRCFALFQLLGSGETALYTGYGDDYVLYRGENDSRFILPAHDLDSILGLDSGVYNRTLFQMCPFANTTTPGSAATTVTNLNRFMTNRYFAPIYFSQIDDLLNTSLSLSNVSLTVDRTLSDWSASAAMPGLKTWYTNRYNWVRTQIKTNLTVMTPLPTTGGFPYSTSPTISLGGETDIRKTVSLLVNGNPSDRIAYMGIWTNKAVALQPGINHILIESVDANGSVFASTNFDVWYYVPAATTVGGTISTNTLWSAANGPYLVSSSITVPNGVTLTIEAGSAIYLGSSVSINVANGGRLLAEGTRSAHIRFSSTPGTTTTWGGFRISGSGDSPETRLAYVDIQGDAGTGGSEGNACIVVPGGTLYLDHANFLTRNVQYLSLDGASFIVQNSYFPSVSTSIELVHGTLGVKAGGHGIFLRNYWGVPIGYNDVIDFTGGNRPGTPLVEFIDNVFIGATDDVLDLDGTDAWVEGNLFMHIHRNNTSDTASGVSGGSDGGNTSEVTVINNIFYDCDHAMNAKQGNFFTFFNNTVIHQNHAGGIDTAGAVLLLSDNGAEEGAGMYLEGNIIYDIEAMTRNQVNAIITLSNNLLPVAWSGPGGNNTVGADPLFNHLPEMWETYFTSWEGAQKMKQWLAVQEGSAAKATGHNGLDKGAAQHLGISISGEPDALTSRTAATLTLGINRSGSSIPAGPWNNGSGFVAYKWRLDGGTWSAETPIGTPLTLTSLSAGPHQVQVVGKRDTGFYQNDPVNGDDAVITSSRSWYVDTAVPVVRINEVLVVNQSEVVINGKTPDLVELYNPRSVVVDLSGMSISDERDLPGKYIFPAGSTIPAGGYLTLYGDNEATPAGHHLGFAFHQDGDQVYLFSPEGQVADSVEFGMQIADYSIGRLSDGSWGLTYPTFGSINSPAPLGDVHKIRINEWLTHGVTAIPYDFVELFNQDALPVALGGLYLTDNFIGAPALNRIPDLSFVRGGGFPIFYADNNGSAGPTHLNFKLSGDRGIIALMDRNLALLDYIFYGPQHTDLSQGRTPSGSSSLAVFNIPTPGGPNPAPEVPINSKIVINEVLAKNIHWFTNSDGGTPSWIELYNPTTNTITLADMSLSDDAATPRKFVFPSSQTLDVGAYLVVLFDPSLPASSNVVSLPNAGFGIRDNGGSVFLFDKLANGGAQVDAISYGVQATDWSIGRYPSGATNWMLTLPTFGYANASTVVGNPLQIRVNEWMASPSSGSDWFELYNPNAQPVDISGYYLSDDVSSPSARQQFQIAPLSFIGTDLYGYVRFWADKSLTGPDHVNFALAAGGESIGLTASGDVLVNAIQFAAQSAGVSEGRLPDGAAVIVKFPSTPTPGDANFLPLTSIVINEVLTAPRDSKCEQAIELQNVTTNTIDIGGWFLSNMRHDLRKYQIPRPTILTPGQFVVLFENQFNSIPGDNACFRLDDIHGDNLHLSVTGTNDLLTGYRTTVEFGPAEPGISFGRYTNSQRQVDFTALSQTTFGHDNPVDIADFRMGTGAQNAAPLISPVVFAEIMYHPPDISGIDNVRDEYLRLKNRTGSSVALYDALSGTNTWHVRGGVDFNFPAAVTLGAGESLLVVSFDPVSNLTALAAFRAAHSQLSTNLPLYGPYSGKLDNGGEALKINKPGAPVASGPYAGEVPYIEAEYVKYGDSAPWDPLPDGSTASLFRRNAGSYANDPTNWFGAYLTASSSSLDSDGDGVQDWWMLQYFGHSTGLAADHSLATDDYDNDGMSNLQEFGAGTSPTSSSSKLKVAVTTPGNGSTTVILNFSGVKGKSYTVQYKDNLIGTWLDLTGISALTTNATVWVTNAVPDGVSPRFYRVTTP
jgi:hypothetical protein